MNPVLNWSHNAAKELAMDSAHIPQIQAIIERHYEAALEAANQSMSEVCRRIIQAGEETEHLTKKEPK